MRLAQEGPGEAVVAALGQESENPERVWNASMATTTALEVASLANQARAAQVSIPKSPCPAHDLAANLEVWILASTQGTA